MHTPESEPEFVLTEAHVAETVGHYEREWQRSEPAYQRVTAALGRVTGFQPGRAQGAWRCPAHDDGTPSLSVNLGDKGVVLHCHAGCRAEDVVAALGLQMFDLFDADEDERPDSPARPHAASVAHVGKEAPLGH